MAFLENPFALLNDTDGDDAKLFAAVPAKAENNPGNKRNTNRQKPQSPSAAPSKSPMTPNTLHSGLSENWRGNSGRRSQRYNSTGLNWLDNRQNSTPQSDNGQSNGYSRQIGYADRNKQDGDGASYWQNSQGNGYRKVNRQSNIHEENNDGGYRHYRRGSGSAGYEKNGSKQQEWRESGGDRRKEFNKINGPRKEGHVLEVNQLVESQVQEMLSEGNSFKGDEHQVRNAGWNFVGDRRGSGGRGGPQGNGGWENRFSSRLGGLNEGKGEASVHQTKESLNGEPRDSGEKNASIRRKETTEESNDAEPRQGNHERVTKRNQSENLIKEEKEVNNMTLEEYEKQLIEKRKALEALKQQERKVTLDKDFKLMQLVGRKKDDFAAKLNSEKDRLEEEESLEKDENVQLKKEESPEQDEKVRKLESIDVFLKVFKRSDRVPEEHGGYRRDFKRGGIGRGHGGERKEIGHYSGGYSRNGVENVVKAAPDAGKSNTFPTQSLKINIQDSEHFPGLGAIAKA